MSTENSTKVFQALSSLFVQSPPTAAANKSRPGSVVVMTEAWYHPGRSQCRISQYVEGHQAELAGSEQFPREIHHEAVPLDPAHHGFDVESVAKDCHRELLAELRAEIQKHSLIIDERCLLEERGGSSPSKGTPRFDGTAGGARCSKRGEVGSG